ncbi:flavodoxin domain-containing protein [Streptomyces sp. XM83C]|jgi:menaquinone-dependent protoporphyrinogen oxidase|uniref:Flavodoxin domain-containing protein n=1 Tax=Streptomyces thermocoprophilus TaxID=78356 RepID=A0ABV5V701_9ACTN|nr:flavodoxin domain-containing protein [Streptomyces sp. XM83C]MCK1819403.1 flavodoxin domain-containing protein [Streptomyces sp. XM83C]
MNAKVLVAYGSTNGSTARIADAVAAVLDKEGLTAETRPAGSVQDVSPYDAVVIGGGLYAGRWHKDSRRFARRHRQALAERPVWLFSSGPLDPSAGERDIPPVPGVRRIMDRVGAREHVTFGGCLEEGAKGWVARMILKDGKGGDFRDFGRIEAWAARVAGELTGARQER